MKNMMFLLKNHKPVKKQTFTKENIIFGCVIKNLYLLIFLSLLLFLTSCYSVENFATDNEIESPNKTSVINSQKIDFVYDIDTNSNKFVQYEPCYISVNYPKTDYEKLNQEFDFWAKQKITEFYNNNYDSNESEFTIEYQKYNIDNKLESFKFDIFSNGKTGKSSGIETKTYNDTGTLIYFKNDTEEQKQSLERLSNFVRQYVAENKLEELALDKEKFSQALESKSENYNSFTIDEQYVVFYFDENLIGETVNNIAIQIPIAIDDIFEICKGVYPEIEALKEHIRTKTISPTAQEAPEQNTADPADTQKKYLAITFDDGPHEVFTDRLLDELDILNIRATFFLLGQKAQANSAIVEKMYTNGHEIGNHSYSHPDFRKMTFDEIKNQIEQTNSIIFDITGVKPTSLRTPYGIINDNIKDISRGADMKIVLWDVDPRDWQSKNSEQIKEHIVSNVKNGDIIILHDIYETTVDGVVLAIAELKNLGYEFLTVSELLSLGETVEAGNVYYMAKLNNQ